MKVYYAHPMSIYDTKQEDRDMETLCKLGMTPVNPNNLHTEIICAQYRRELSAERIMEEVFKPMVQQCEALAFRAFPDGSISVGVAKEIQYAQEAGLPIFELPSGLLRRSLTIDQTREVLAELGQR